MRLQLPEKPDDLRKSTVHLEVLRAGLPRYQASMTGEQFVALSLPPELEELHAVAVAQLASSYRELAALGEQPASPSLKPVDASAQSPSPTESPTAGSPEESTQGTAQEAAPGAEASPNVQAPDDGYTQFLIQRPGETDLRIRAKVIARNESAWVNGRCHVFAVLKTPGGKFVGVKEGLTMWPGERDKAQVTIANSLKELTTLFGFTPLAKDLYTRLGDESLFVETIE